MFYSYKPIERSNAFSLCAKAAKCMESNPFSRVGYDGSKLFSIEVGEDQLGDFAKLLSG